jgi:hypothetical protein
MFEQEDEEEEDADPEEVGVPRFPKRMVSR